MARRARGWAALRERRLGLLIALTALAVAGRLLLLALPNVSLTFLVVVVAGLAYGARMGAAVGALGMLLTSAMLVGPSPSAIAPALAVAGLGAGAGLLRRARFPGPRRTGAGTAFAAGLGFGCQVLFSVAADAGNWLLFAYLPEGGAALPLLALMVAGGLVFNLLPALFQAALFAGALQPVVHALRAAGLAEDPAPRRRRALRVVVIARAGSAPPG